MHEGFDLALDPTIAETLPSFQELKQRRVDECTAQNDKDKHEALGDGGNLWPSAEIWSGATEFVRLPEDTNIMITSHV